MDIFIKGDGIWLPEDSLSESLLPSYLGILETLLMYSTTFPSKSQILLGGESEGGIFSLNTVLTKVTSLICS